MYSQKNNNHQLSYHLPKLNLPTVKPVSICHSDRSINKNQSKLQQMLSQFKPDEDDKKRVDSILKGKDKISEIVSLPKEYSYETRRITLSRPKPQKLHMLFSKKQCKTEEQYESETELDFKEMDDYDQSSIFSQKKKIDAIRTKLKESANESYFGFIKQQEKMKDLYLNYQDEQDTIQDDKYYYCLNDDIFPKKIELMLTDETFDLSDQGVTSKYIPIIVNYLKQKPIKQLNLSGNRFNEWTLRQLVDQFPQNLKTLDLSNNELGRPGGLLLSNHILKLKSLTNLNLSCNQLGDAGIQGLLTNLIRHTNLKKLNLSENNLTDSIQLTLFSFISTNSTIENIILCWNKLGIQSWNLIIKALQLNRQLRILDLSYNKINSNENDEVQLTNYYNTFCNLNLVHLDISFNQFGLKFMQMLRQALSKNEILYGLHVQGNKCAAYIDQLGFIQIEQEDKQIYSIPPTHHKIDGVKFLPLGNEDLSGNDNCWICQGWMEYQFVYLPKQEFGELYIHFDFLNYRPIQMITSIDLLNLLKQRNISKNIILELTSGEIMHQLKEIVTSEKNITLSAINEAFQTKQKSSNLFLEELLDDLEKFYYMCYMMLPPNRKVHYFYSSSIRDEAFYNHNLPTIQRPINDLNNENYIQVKDQQIKITNQVNFIQTKQMFVIDPKNNYKPFVKVLPRCTTKYRIDLNRFEQGSNRKRINFIHWKREDSIFSQYRQEDEGIIEQCFNFDWECSSIKNNFHQEYDLNQLKKSIRHFYPLIKDFYKFHSSEGYKPPHLLIFCVTFVRCEQILLQFSKICDSQIVLEEIKKLKHESQHKYIYNPNQGIIRYQFLELLFRMAILQQTNKRVFADAVNRFFKQFEINLLNFDKISEWRVQRLWTKECSLLIQLKHIFLSQLFEKVASIRNEKWSFKLKWVSLYDLIEFCYIVGLSEFVGEAEIKIIYNYSIQTEVDEVSIDKTIRMGYLEFIEALARLAELVSFAPVGQNILEWTQDDRQVLPLHVKFESFLTYIMSFYKKEYEKYTDLFDLSLIPQLPTRMQKYNDKYEDSNLFLTVYNTLHYLNLHAQPYLNPKYKEFLAQSGNLNTQKSKSPGRSPGRVLRSQKTIKYANPRLTRKNVINY